MTGHGTIRAATLKTIIAMISEHFNISEDEALKAFYESHIGACFSDDETGLYGQSALYVFSLFLEEQFQDREFADLDDVKSFGAKE